MLQSNSFKRCFLSFFLIIVNVFFIINISYGQASLEIVTLDEDKKPVSDILVKIYNTNIGFKNQLITDDNGIVIINNLDAIGTYNILIEPFKIIKKDIEVFYQGQSREKLKLISSKTTRVVITLEEKRKTLNEIVITAKHTENIMNTYNAEVSSTLTPRELNAVPFEGRDVVRSLVFMPNVTPATGFFPEAPPVSINGANALFTHYTIDGLDNNENFLGGQRFPTTLGMTSSVTLFANNFGVENGLSANGIVNIDSKSGTNDLSGNLYYTVRPGNIIDASSSYAQRDLSGNLVKDGFQRHQFGFDIGGPIIKNKTFYHINLEHTTDIKDNLLVVPQLKVNETIRGQNQMNYISSKIDHKWKSFWKSSLRLNIGLVNIERQGGGVEGGVNFPSTGNKQIRNSLNIALKNKITLGTATLQFNYQLSTFSWNYANPTNPNLPNVSLEDESGTLIANIGHPGFVFEESETTHQFQQKISFIPWKKHVLKLGINIQYSDFNLYGGGNRNGSYIVSLSNNEIDRLANRNIGAGLMPSHIPQTARVKQYQIELRPQQFGTPQLLTSVYWEDNWSLAYNFNITFGIRYDYDSLTKGGSDTADTNNLAPRISANYKLSDNTTIRGGFGVYYNKIIYAVISDALQFNSTSSGYKKQLNVLKDKGLLHSSTNINNITFEGTVLANNPNTTYLQGASSASLQSQRNNIFQNELRILNPFGYDNPYSNQWMLGIQQKIGEKYLVYLDYINNHSFSLFRIKNINAPSAYPIKDSNNVKVRTLEEADKSRPVPILKDENGNYAMINGERVNAVARNVIMTESAGESKYQALNITVQKERLNDKYSFRLWYTWSTLKNNTEDINFKAMDANNYDNEWGASINDRTHVINWIFTYYFIKAMSATLTYSGQSGQPINYAPDKSRFGTIDLNGDGYNIGAGYVGDSDRYPGFGRNTGRLPWVHTFNLKLSTKIKVYKDQDIFIHVEVFNLLNRDNYSGYSSNISQNNQIQTGPDKFEIKNTAPPRQFQFSIAYKF